MHVGPFSRRKRATYITERALWYLCASSKSTRMSVIWKLIYYLSCIKGQYSVGPSGNFLTPSIGSEQLPRTRNVYRNANGHLRLGLVCNVIPILNNVSFTSVEVVVEIDFEPRWTHKHKCLGERFPYCYPSKIVWFCRSER